MQSYVACFFVCEACVEQVFFFLPRLFFLNGNILSYVRILIAATEILCNQGQCLSFDILFLVFIAVLDAVHLTVVQPVDWRLVSSGAECWMRRLRWEILARRSQFHPMAPLFWSSVDSKACYIGLGVWRNLIFKPSKLLEGLVFKKKKKKQEERWVSLPSPWIFLHAWTEWTLYDRLLRSGLEIRVSCSMRTKTVNRIRGRSRKANLNGKIQLQN